MSFSLRPARGRGHRHLRGSRTAGGRLTGWHPADLAAQALDALIARGESLSRVPML